MNSNLRHLEIPLPTTQAPNWDPHNLDTLNASGVVELKLSFANETPHIRISINIDIHETSDVARQEIVRGSNNGMNSRANTQVGWHIGWAKSTTQGTSFSPKRRAQLADYQATSNLFFLCRTPTIKPGGWEQYECKRETGDTGEITRLKPGRQ